LVFEFMPRTDRISEAPLLRHFPVLLSVDRPMPAEHLPQFPAPLNVRGQRGWDLSPIHV
jgi:hypothetical protein